MSEAQEKMKRLEESSNKEILERAWAEITALCSEGKQWRMTIPVDADRDSDVLFGEVLKRFAQLEAALDKRLRQEYMDEDHRLGGIGITFEQFKEGDDAVTLKELKDTYLPNRDLDELRERNPNEYKRQTEGDFDALKEGE